jgi:hypothetical protein
MKTKLNLQFLKFLFEILFSMVNIQQYKNI